MQKEIDNLTLNDLEKDYGEKLIKTKFKGFIYKIEFFDISSGFINLENNKNIWQEILNLE